jgi:hypothetical protein
MLAAILLIVREFIQILNAIGGKPVLHFTAAIAMVLDE